MLSSNQTILPEERVTVHRPTLGRTDALSLHRAHPSTRSSSTAGGTIPHRHVSHSCISCSNSRAQRSPQGNNMYIFPGLGLGAVASGATMITDKCASSSSSSFLQYQHLHSRCSYIKRMFYIAARTLASFVTEEELQQGRVYPEISNIREVSKKIAVESSFFFVCVCVFLHSCTSDHGHSPLYSFPLRIQRMPQPFRSSPFF